MRGRDELQYQPYDHKGDTGNETKPARYRNCRNDPFNRYLKFCVRNGDGGQLRPCGDRHDLRPLRQAGCFRQVPAHSPAYADPEGNTWILKGFQLGLNPQQTWEEYLAKGAANYKKLPPEWKFRVKTLEKDVIEIPDNNLATIMTDELFHVWDKTGPGMTNYKP